MIHRAQFVCGRMASGACDCEPYPRGNLTGSPDSHWHLQLHAGSPACPPAHPHRCFLFARRVPLNQRVTWRSPHIFHAEWEHVLSAVGYILMWISLRCVFCNLHAKVLKKYQICKFSARNHRKKCFFLLSISKSICQSPFLLYFECRAVTLCFYSNSGISGIIGIFPSLFHLFTAPFKGSVCWNYILEVFDMARAIENTASLRTIQKIVVSSNRHIDITIPLFKINNPQIISFCQYFFVTLRWNMYLYIKAWIFMPQITLIRH